MQIAAILYSPAFTYAVRCAGVCVCVCGGAIISQYMHVAVLKYSLCGAEMYAMEMCSEWRMAGITRVSSQDSWQWVILFNRTQCPSWVKICAQIMLLLLFTSVKKKESQCECFYIGVSSTLNNMRLKMLSKRYSQQKSYKT